MKISAVVSDVDGTLVRADKTLSETNRRAVLALRDRDIRFALVSSRPPRGLIGMIKALEVDTVIAGFNGAVVATPDLRPLETHWLAPDLARRTVAVLREEGADVSVFSDLAWYLQHPDPARVTQEIVTVQFKPTVVTDYDGVLEKVGKIVGVSDDPGLLSRCESRLRVALGASANVVRSQTYNLDITAHGADKGAAVRAIARHLDVPLSEILVIGDAENDIAMLRVAGFSVAMGNAEAAVREAADGVTGTNQDDGFAQAMGRVVLADHGIIAP